MRKVGIRFSSPNDALFQEWSIGDPKMGLFWIPDALAADYAVDRAETLIFAGTVVAAGKRFSDPADAFRSHTGGALAGICPSLLIGAQPVLTEISALIRVKGCSEIRFGQRLPAVGRECKSREGGTDEQGKTGGDGCFHSRLPRSNLFDG